MVECHICKADDREGCDCWAVIEEILVPDAEVAQIERNLFRPTEH
jgi:hypothetical protein